MWSDARPAFSASRCNVPPARALFLSRSSHLSSFSCDVHACRRVPPSSRNVNRATEPALALLPATTWAEIVEADVDSGRLVELLLCESLLCTDGPGDCIGWPTALRKSLRAGRGGGVLVSSGYGVVVGRADAFCCCCCCCRRVLEGRRTSEGRRTMKLLMTSETENAGISGELRFLDRARGDFEVCCVPS